MKTLLLDSRKKQGDQKRYADRDDEQFNKRETHLAAASFDILHYDSSCHKYLVPFYRHR